MKKTMLLFAAILLLTACSTEKNNIVITGKFDKLKNVAIRLSEIGPDIITPLDSITTDSTGFFSFNYYSNFPKFILISTQKNGHIALIVKPKEQIAVYSDTTFISYEYTVGGSFDSDLVRALTMQLFKTGNKIKNIEQQYKAAHSVPGINIDSIKSVLNTEYELAIDAQKKFSIGIVESNYTSLACILALSQYVNPKLPVFRFNNDYKWYEMTDSALWTRYPMSSQVIAFHEFVKQRTEERKKIVQFEIGSTPPEIKLPNPNGDTTSLYALRGKYVLLDFWASWCKPCRTENPFLVENSTKYAKKGFSIFQVSLDKSKDEWLKAIEIDQLKWYHASDLKYWNSETAKVYGINNIPANFLLNPEGKIIAKNLRGKELTAKLDSIFQPEISK